MTFVQIIDCRTSKLDDMNRLMDTWVEQTEGKRTATHSIVGRDHTDAGHLVEIIEFPSYEEAMKNSNLPETDRTFQEMVALCDEMPTFIDLDVVRDEPLNAAAARRFFEEIATEGKLDLIGELFAPDYRDHDIGKSEESTVGSDVLRQDVKRWRGAFDFRFALDDQVAEGDRVVTRWTWTGRHRGDFMGIAPTGRECRMTGTTIFRFRDGRVQEGWWYYDQLGLMRQLGVVEA